MKYLYIIGGMLASIVMAIFTGKNIEKTKQAKRDKKAQQKVSEVYRDSEEQFNKDVADGRSGDPRDHFK